MDAIIDYRGKTPTKTSSGIPLITAKIIKDGAIQPVAEYIAEEDYDSWMRRGIPRPGDIVMTTEAPLGEVAQLDNRKIALAQRVITLRGKEGVLENTFLKYLMISEYVQHQLDGRATGTTVKGIKQSELRKILLKFPSWEEQRQIANILGTIDDKIALNCQINTTLESMARALFKSWFVDFDPVIDNALAAGNPIPEPFIKRATARAEHRKSIKESPVSSHPPLPADIQQLFPSSFVFTEAMGWVPEGWMVRTIGDVFNLLGGHPFKSSEYVDDGTYGIVTIKNVQDANFVEACSNRLSAIPEKMKKHCFLQAGDILLSLTGNVGRVCVVSPGNYLLNQRVAKIIGKNGISNSFAYFFFRQKSVFDRMITIAKGTAQQNLSPIETAKIGQVLPNDNLIIETQRYLDVLFEKVLSNTSQLITLSDLRDLMLPKLLSGQLPIPDAEAAVEEAMGNV